MRLPLPVFFSRPKQWWPSWWKKKRVPAAAATVWAVWAACRGWICKVRPDFRRALAERQRRSGREKREGCGDSPLFRTGGVSRFLGDPQHPSGCWAFLAAGGQKKVLRKQQPKKSPERDCRHRASTSGAYQKGRYKHPSTPASIIPRYSKTFCAFAHIKKARNGIAVFRARYFECLSGRRYTPVRIIPLCPETFCAV